MDGPLLNQTFNNHSVYVYKLFAEIMILHNLLGSTRRAIFECPECSMEFETKLRLTTHLSIIHGEDFEGKHDILLLLNENAYQGKIYVKRKKWLNTNLCWYFTNSNVSR